MVEREEPERAPGREHAAEHPVESGRPDDRAGGSGEPEAASAPPAAGEGAELIDNRESDSAAAVAAGSNTAETPDEPGVAAAADSTGAGEQNESEQDTEKLDTAQQGGDSDAAEFPDQSTSEETPSTSDGSTDATVLDFRQRPSVTDADTEQATAEGLIDADEVGTEPLNLSEIQSDDALLDALGGTNPSVPGESEEAGPALESLLVAWRREVDAAPIGELVELDEAAGAIAAGRRPRRRSRRRHLVPVASAAAVLMIGFTGVGLAARDAMPGDMLWGVATVLYADHSRSSLAVDAAQQDLNVADSALQENRTGDAKQALERALEHMKAVEDGQRLDQLRSTHRELLRRYEGGTSPSEPSTSETSTSTHQPTSMTPSPPPSQLPLPPPEPSVPPTTPSTPSSSQVPTTSPSAPSETSGTSDRPSSGIGTTGGMTSDSNSFFPN